MSEDGEADRRPAGRDPLLAASLAAAANSARYDDLIARQIRLSELQIDSLEKQDEYELSHLRWRRFNDQLKGAMQIMLVALGLLIVIAIAAAIWSATQAKGLVIESFQTSSDLARKGLTGETLASKLLDRLSVMQNATSSIAAPSQFRSGWTDEIRVAIPDTGISIGEAMRYLREALGNETHLTGEMYEAPDGLALTVRLPGQPGQTFAGRAGDLDRLVEQAAETVFRWTQPYRYSTYLNRHGRGAEALPLLKIIAEHGLTQDRFWANFALSLRAIAAGHYGEALVYARRAHAATPNQSGAVVPLRLLAAWHGHDEEALKYARKWLTLFEHGLNPAIMDGVKANRSILVDQALGDYRDALAQEPVYARDPNASPFSVTLETAGVLAMLHDTAAARAQLANLKTGPAYSGHRPPNAGGTFLAANFAIARGQTAISITDWRGAAQGFEEALAAARKSALDSNGQLSDRAYREVLAAPWLAYSYAMLGERAKSHAILQTLPPDCYVCTRLRGNIAAQEKRYAAADWWFARAVKQAPSIPFAYADWGEMLLRKGDLDGAIAKFESAHQKGPHFADPLEMWGEALIAKNRSDLALPKFEEANKYAPNWGRLHLKWGEALLWSGDKAGAQKQFAAAAHLDLTPSEKSQLARMEAIHG